MKEKTWIRLIAIFKILKGLLLIGVSFEIFRHIHANLETIATEFLSFTRIDPDNHLIRYGLEKFINLSPATIKKFGISALLYSSLVLTEGFGLWFEQRWAEYLIIVSSGVFVPIEIREIVKHPSILKCCILALNIAILIYLCKVVRSKVKKRK